MGHGRLSAAAAQCPLMAIIIGRGLVAWHAATANGTEVAAGLTFGIGGTEATKVSSSNAAKRRLEKI